MSEKVRAMDLSKNVRTINSAGEKVQYIIGFGDGVEEASELVRKHPMSGTA